MDLKIFFRLFKKNVSEASRVILITAYTNTLSTKKNIKINLIDLHNNFERFKTVKT